MNCHVTTSMGLVIMVVVCLVGWVINVNKVSQISSTDYRPKIEYNLHLKTDLSL